MDGWIGDGGGFPSSGPVRQGLAHCGTRCGNLGNVRPPSGRRWVPPLCFWVPLGSASASACAPRRHCRGASCGLGLVVVCMWIIRRSVCMWIISRSMENNHGSFGDLMPKHARAIPSRTTPAVPTPRSRRSPAASHDSGSQRNLRPCLKIMADG